MITYELLRGHPSAFRSLTGLSVPAFESLHARFVALEAQERTGASVTRHEGRQRKRAPGAGRKYRHDARTRLLMALVWLRIYPTYEVLGFLFSIHRSGAFRSVENTLGLLERLSGVSVERPGPDDKPLSTIEQVVLRYPQARLIIDAKEQRVTRPQGTDAQRPYYSGKKRAITLKSQIAVERDGTICHISASVPGAVHDLTLLRGSGLLETLRDGEGALFDEGYVGIQKDYPHLALHLPYRKRLGLDPLQREENWRLGRERVKIEHTFAQMNQFQSLAQVYRHSKQNHRRTVCAVSLLVNHRKDRRQNDTTIAG